MPSPKQPNTKELHEMFLSRNAFDAVTALELQERYSITLKKMLYNSILVSPVIKFMPLNTSFGASNWPHKSAAATSGSYV